MLWVRDENTSIRMVLVDRGEDHGLWVSSIDDTDIIAVRLDVEGV